MQSVRPKFLHFLHDFILLKLAYHFRVDPSAIQVRSLDNPVANFDLVYQGKTYSIKMSNPLKVSQKGKALFWDFDVRKSLYEGGMNKRVKRDEEVCDYYLLIGLENNVPQKMFLIASMLTPKGHVRISVAGKSKYGQYLI